MKIILKIKQKTSIGDDSKAEYVSSLMPKQIKKRRKIQSEDGVCLILF